ASPGFLNMTNTLFDIFFLLLCRSRRLSARTLRHSTALGHYSVAVSGCRLHLGWPCGKSLLVFPNRNDRKYLHEQTVEKHEIAKGTGQQGAFAPLRPIVPQIKRLSGKGHARHNDQKSLEPHSHDDACRCDHRPFYGPRPLEP